MLMSPGDNMAIYKSNGTLTGYIAEENLGAAQQYLEADDMTQFLPDDLKSVVLHIGWRLHYDGHGYTVMAVCNRDLTADESKELSSWVSGQNSDGLGESFEQQDFAWDEDEDCEDCSYMNSCGDCGTMISFDWQTNNNEFVRVEQA